MSDINYSIVFKEKEFGALIEEDVYNDYEYALSKYNSKVDQNYGYVELIETKILMKHDKPCTHKFTDTLGDEIFKDNEGEYILIKRCCELCGFYENTYRRDLM